MEYRPVDPKVDFPRLEERILEFWREARVFERSVELRAGAPEWVFYEGPPTANGRPGIHHVEARVFKDIYPRYKAMRGFFVPRKGGWDCHGIPVELEVEKKIGTKTKRDIEAFGVEKFNALCRQSVREYVEEWNRLTERIAFWIDLDEAYWTMDPDYMQSVWWALKELHGRGLLYQDDKVTAYCPRCGTPLSDHEVAMGYAQVEDPSVFVRFPVQDGERQRALGIPSGTTSLLVWTTTPWTLISNLGAAVAPNEPYAIVQLESDGSYLIVAEKLLDRLREVLGDSSKIDSPHPGSELEGLGYDPPYPNTNGNTHRVVTADWVSMEDGSGIVHMAPAFGAEDLDIGRREGWPVYKPVDDEGRFTDAAPEFVRGLFVKDADPAITEDLRRRGLLVRAGRLEHTYPLCWRCDTPLLYMARPAWYVRTTARKEELLRANNQVNWYPGHIKHGRYGDWLANNVDWSLSRERYWGTPLPIWLCSDGHETAVGSLEELSQKAGRDVTGIDPHKPAIDQVTITCPTCGRTASRVPYLIDVWFDAGAMPYAQWNYRGDDSPGAQLFRKRFPADYIAEGLDQTRGWFYTLMAESVMLFGENSYRNVVCLGLLVDAEGRKMSKRLGNVLDPWEVIDQTGADALRWWLFASGSPWSERRTSVDAVRDVVRQFLLTLWNTYAFLVTYANIDRPDPAAAPPPADRPVLDRWALSRLHGLIGYAREGMDAYDATGVARRIEQFVDELSNWYVRRARRRFWDTARSVPGGEAAGVAMDKLAAHATLRECLVALTGLLAPFTPFIADEMYRNLVAEQEPNAPPSVHLTDYPEPDPALVDPELDEVMAVAREIVRLGRQVRTETKVRVRQPLAHAAVHVPGDPQRLSDLLPLISDELNVKEVRFVETERELAGWRAKPNFRILGPKLGPDVRAAAEALESDDGAIAGALATGVSAEVRLADGRVLTLSPGDVELSQRARTGWGVASDGPVTVALELALTPDLEREGVAREVVRLAQDLRKSAGLAVSDRIELALDGAAGAIDAVAAFADHVRAETLATELRLGEALYPADGSIDADLDGRPVRLSLRRAAGV
jgi:isoleucyl-tRNA synthetase